MFAQGSSLSARVRLLGTRAVSTLTSTASLSSRFGLHSSRNALLPVLLVALLVTAMLPGRPGQPSATAAYSKPVRQGAFYNPPKDMSVSTVAQRANILILGRGRESYIDQLRSNGYSGKVLQYILFHQVNGPGPYANRYSSCNSSFDPLSNNAADRVGDFCKYIHPNESWFLHNSAGRRLYKDTSTGVMYYMNPASSGWRAFLRSRIQNRLQSTRYNAMFLDNIELTLIKMQRQLDNSDGRVKEFSSNDSYRDANVGKLGYLASYVGTSKLWGNLISDPNTGTSWNPYMRYLAGAMSEAWGTGYGSGLSVEKWNNNLKQAASVLASGKGLVAIGWGSPSSTTRQTFALASYLLVANSNAFFRYSDGRYSTWLQYSNYQVTLGSPTSSRYQSGSLWKRNFQCGYVSVDPAARVGRIVKTCTTSTSSTAAVDETVINVPEDQPTAEELRDLAAPGVLAEEGQAGSGPEDALRELPLDDTTLTHIPDDVEVELRPDDAFENEFASDGADDATVTIPDGEVPETCVPIDEPVELPEPARQTVTRGNGKAGASDGKPQASCTVQ